MIPELQRIENDVLAKFGTHEDFLEHLDTALRKAGYIYDSEAPCTCEDEGICGHEPCCGWVKPVVLTGAVLKWIGEAAPQVGYYYCNSCHEEFCLSDEQMEKITECPHCGEHFINS